MRVLVTGASGRIGSLLVTRLGAWHDVRGLDLAAPPDSFDGDFVVGDVADPAAVSAAVSGVDAVVHLAGIASEASLDTILHGHAIGTAVVLDSMVQHDVPRMVFASSNHAVGMTPRPSSGLLGADVPPRPDTFYGVGKIAAEALLSLYADRHGISSVAMRIGSFRDRPRSRRELATWLSPDDCVSLVQSALTTELTGVHVVYGISANRDAWWDQAPGQQIGYQPHDDAATYASDIPDDPSDVGELAVVGGAFAAPGPVRHPLDERKERR
jgi:uronate dehydrogenase